MKAENPKSSWTLGLFKQVVPQAAGLNLLWNCVYVWFLCWLIIAKLILWTFYLNNSIFLCWSCPTAPANQKLIYRLLCPARLKLIIGKNRGTHTATDATQNRKSRIICTSFFCQGNEVKINLPANINNPNSMFRCSLSTVKGEETGEYALISAQNTLYMKVTKSAAADGHRVKCWFRDPHTSGNALVTTTNRKASHGVPVSGFLFYSRLRSTTLIRTMNPCLLENTIFFFSARIKWRDKSSGCQNKMQSIALIELSWCWITLSG